VLELPVVQITMAIKLAQEQAIITAIKAKALLTITETKLGVTTKAIEQLAARITMVTIRVTNSWTTKTRKLELAQMPS